MSCPSPIGGAAVGPSKSNLLKAQKRRARSAQNQPLPATPGVTREMVREHARRLFRDKWSKEPLTLKEWRLAEENLVRTLESEAL